MKKRGNLQLSVRKGKDFYLFCFYGYRRLGTTIWDAERAIALASAVLFESR